MFISLDVGIPAPPHLESNVEPAFMLAFFSATGVGALVFAAVLAVRRRDFLPVACCLGALLCAANEPIFDILGKIVYAQDHPTAFTAFGRDIPWFLVIGYVAWVGLLPYLVAGWIAAGWSRARLYLVSIVGVTSVIGVEVVNLYADSWEYYGEAPLKFFGGVAAMASVPLTAGYLLYALALPLSGWRRGVAGVLIPTFSLPMMFAATGWPLYIALHADLSPFWDYVAIAALLGLITVAVIAVVTLADKARTDPRNEFLGVVGGGQWVPSRRRGTGPTTEQPEKSPI